MIVGGSNTHAAAARGTSPSATPVRGTPQEAVTSSGRQDVKGGDDQLLGFLRNITRADAAMVLALTSPSQAGATQSHAAAAAAYGEF